MFGNQQSGLKSPGFIGLCIGLLTLVVFCLLGSAALGGKFNAEAPIDKQIEVAEARIERLQKTVDRVTQERAEAQERYQAESAYKELSLNKKRLDQKRGALIQELGRARSELTRVEASLSKEAQRVRKASIGKSLSILQTQSGATYRDVRITNVTADGVVVSRGSKSKAIPAKDLPPKLQERFLFTEESVAQTTEQQREFVEQTRQQKRVVQERVRETAAQLKAKNAIEELQAEVTDLERKMKLAEVKIDEHKAAKRQNMAQHLKIRANSSSSSSGSARNSTYSLRAHKEQEAIDTLKSQIDKARIIVSEKKAEIRKLYAQAN